MTVQAEILTTINVMYVCKRNTQITEESFTLTANLKHIMNMNQLQHVRARVIHSEIIIILACYLKYDLLLNWRDAKKSWVQKSTRQLLLIWNSVRWSPKADLSASIQYQAALGWRKFSDFYNRITNVLHHIRWSSLWSVDLRYFVCANCKKQPRNAAQRVTQIPLKPEGKDNGPNEFKPHLNAY